MSSAIDSQEQHSEENEPNQFNLNLETVIWPDKLLSIFKALEKEGFELDIKLVQPSENTAMNLKGFEDLFNNNGCCSDDIEYVIFNAMPKSPIRTSNGSQVHGMVDYLHGIHDLHIYFGKKFERIYGTMITIVGDEQKNILGLVAGYAFR